MGLYPGTYNAGFISRADWSGPTAEIAAQAIALHEMANPGALGRATEGSANDLAAIQAAVAVALQGYSEGRLSPTDGGLAHGWAEVFPGLTDDKKRLGHLPGFTQSSATSSARNIRRRSWACRTIRGRGRSRARWGTWFPRRCRRPNGQILGDSTGGGHRAGTGAPNKSEFPSSWTDEKILDAIREVAGTGAVEKPARRPGELEIVGAVDGVRIKAIVTANGDVRTAYPISGPGVEKNPVER